MSKYHVSPECNAELLRHLRDWGKFVSPDLVNDWRKGVDFLHDFGIIDMEQRDELRKMFPEEVPPEC
jgi:hypothetical protein